MTRDVPKMKVGQVAYTHWCDGQGKVIDDGTVSRLDERRLPVDGRRPQPALVRPNGHGLDVTVEDITERAAALALQGPTSRDILPPAWRATWRP